MNKLSKIFLLLISLIILVIIACDVLIQVSSYGKTYNSIYKVPKKRVGLLLGTSKFFKDGSPNLYYKNRVSATASLFFAGKIEYVLISGDNSEMYYNEPNDMKKALIKKGVPEDKIFLDFAGFRTYDSIIRAEKVFETKSYIVISQEYHNQRAIYISNKFGHDAIAYNARNIKSGLYIGQYFREKLARVKVFIDFIFDVEPKFLGKKIEIK